jgi:alkylhydroperoxidase family enzyme
MRTSSARIEPIELEQASEEVREMLESVSWNGVVPNLHRTMATYPSALTAFKAWGKHVLRGGNSLSDRQREIMVLRVGWLCRAGYEWVAHVEIGKDAGLTDAEIEQLKTGSSHPDWEPGDRDLVRAAEEIHADRFVSDETWNALSTHLDRNQCMDVVFTVAQYELVCTILNSFGVQFDGDRELPADVRAAWNL